MGFRTQSYATVWSIEPGNGNFTKVRLSISRKNKNTGEFEQDFSGICKFIGNAHAKAGRLKERDRIILGDVDVTNHYYKERNITYHDYKVFDFTYQDKRSQQEKKQEDNPVEGNTVESDDDDCPF